MSRLRAVVVTAATLIGVSYLTPSNPEDSAPEPTPVSRAPRTAEAAQKPTVTPPQVATVAPVVPPQAPRAPEVETRPPAAAPQPGIHPVTITPKPPAPQGVRKVELPPDSTPPSATAPPKPQRVLRKPPAAPVEERPAEATDGRVPPRSGTPSKSDPVRRITITANPNAAPAPRDGETDRPLAPQRRVSETPSRPDARSPIARAEPPSWETRVIQPRRPERLVAETPKRPEPPQQRAPQGRDAPEQLPNVLRLGQAPQAPTPPSGDRSQLPRPMPQVVAPGRPVGADPRIVAAPPPAVGADPRAPSIAPQSQAPQDQSPQAQSPQAGVRQEAPAKPKVTAQRYTPSYYVGATNRRPAAPTVVYPSRGGSSVARGGRVFFGNASRTAP